MTIAELNLILRDWSGATAAFVDFTLSHPHAKLELRRVGDALPLQIMILRPTYMRGFFRWPDAALVAATTPKVERIEDSDEVRLFDERNDFEIRCVRAYALVREPSRS